MSKMGVFVILVLIVFALIYGERFNHDSSWATMVVLSAMGLVILFCLFLVTNA